MPFRAPLRSVCRAGSTQCVESADALVGPTQERLQGGEHGVHVGPTALWPPPAPLCAASPRHSSHPPPPELPASL